MKISHKSLIENCFFNLSCFLFHAAVSPLGVLQILSNANSALGFTANTDPVLDYSIVVDKPLCGELLIPLTVSVRLSPRKWTCALQLTISSEWVPFLRYFESILRSELERDLEGLLDSSYRHSSSHSWTDCALFWRYTAITCRLSMSYHQTS